MGPWAAMMGALAPILTWRCFALIAAIALVASITLNASVAAGASITLEVEAAGSLPGFHSGELRRYLVLHMAGTRLADWRFEPGATDTPAPNRVVWTFKLKPHAGGEVRGFVPPDMLNGSFRGRRPISIEARLYLNWEYQVLVSGEATTRGGPDDPDLATAIASLTESLLDASGAYRAIDIGQPYHHPPR